MKFWNNFWRLVKKKFDEYEEHDRKQLKIQPWEDIRHYSPLAIANIKLTSLVCDEATIDIVTDSTQVNPLIPLAESLESKRYEICAMMNGKGGCFITMATDEGMEPYHVIIAPEDVSVYRMVANKIYEVAMVIDKKTVKHREYRLIRHHILSENGTLYVYYYTTDRSGNEEYLAEWEHYKNDNVMYLNANNIGVAYFKSPQDSRGNEPLWGVPLNFGCEEVEEEINKDREALSREMKKAEMKLFVDRSITRLEHTQNGDRYGIPEDVYVIQKKAGVDGGLIDEFAPTTRFDDYKKKLDLACADWEDTVGLNRGFLTEAEHTAGATATEIRAANVKTISFIKKIQTAMLDGFKATLEADAMFLNIPIDLWSLKIDWFDAFQDEESQYKRLANAVDRGIAEKADEMQWLFPNLTQEEIDKKIERINTANKVNSDMAIERILNGD